LIDSISRVLSFDEDCVAKVEKKKPLSSLSRVISAALDSLDPGILPSSQKESAAPFAGLYLAVTVVEILVSFGIILDPPSIDTLYISK